MRAENQRPHEEPGRIQTFERRRRQAAGRAHHDDRVALSHCRMECDLPDPFLYNHVCDPPHLAFERCFELDEKFGEQLRILAVH